MRLTIFTVLLLISLQAQSQKAKNIHDLLGLSRDCSVLASDNMEEEEVMEEEVEFMVEAVLPPPPPPPLPPAPGGSDTKPFNIQDYSKTIKAHFKKVNYSPSIKFGDKEFFLNDEDKWGLRNQRGKVEIKPIYDHVQTDTSWSGYLALKDGKINFYDATGEPYFDKGFYHLKPLKGLKYFIFNTPEGYGLIDNNGKIILEPSYYYIYEESSNGKTFIIGRTKDDFLDILTPNGKEIKLKLAYQGGSIVDERYLSTGGMLIDLKTGKKLFCDKNYMIYALDKERGWFTLQDRINKKTYIINAKGELITDKSFIDSPSFFGEIARASVSKEKKSRYDDDKKYGILNKDLEWIIEPTYRRIGFIQDFEYITVTNEFGQRGVLDHENNPIIPVTYAKIEAIGNVVLASRPRANPPVSDVYDLNTGKLLKSNAGLASFGGLGTCNGEQLYVCYLIGGGRAVVNSQYEPILHEKFNNVRTFGNEGIWTEKFGDFHHTYKVFDCAGKPMTLNIDGAEHHEFKNMKELDHRVKKRYLLTLMDDRSFLYNVDIKEAHQIENNIKYISDFGKFKAYTIKTPEDKEGLITNDGKTLLPPVFKSISGHYKKDATVHFALDKNNAGLISRTGEILHTEYSHIYYLGYHLYTVKKGDKRGVIDSKGNILVPIKYTSVKIENGFIIGFSGRGVEPELWGLDGKKI